MSKYIHKVQYYETDRMGLVHHSNYIRWMEEARIDFLESITSPILEVNCKYKSGSTFGDSIEIETRIEKYNGIKVTIGYIMKNVKTKDIVATGDTTLCFINMNNKKPIILKKENSLLDKKLREFCDNKNI
mgnify:CR=1 FL=1